MRPTSDYEFFIISKRRSRRNVCKIVMDIRENGSIFILLRMDIIRPYCYTSHGSIQCLPNVSHHESLEPD
jgi:hypothetical protein